LARLPEARHTNREAAHRLGRAQHCLDALPDLQEKARHRRHHRAEAKPDGETEAEKEELKRSNADLEERLHAAESRGGSLFDLEKDSAEHIIRVFSDPARISADKAKEIANGILAALKTAVTSGTPPQWVVDEDGHSVAIVGKKKCRIWEDDDGQFTAEYQHGRGWREVGVFETEAEAKATCAAKFG
jgi:hypothetical protein